MSRRTFAGAKFFVDEAPGNVPVERFVLVGMRPRSAMSLALLAVCACAEVPTAGELEAAEDEVEAGLSYRAIPSQTQRDPGPAPLIDVSEPVAPYQGAPVITVSDYHASMDEDEVYEFGGTALCPFKVEAEGFPAVSEDGSQFAYWVAETLSSSDGEDESGIFRIVDVETDEVTLATTVFDGDRFDEDHCRKLWDEAKRAARVANERLDKTRWRTMHTVGVDLPDDSGFGVDEEERAAILARPAKDRRVEALIQHGQAIVRIPGVKVLGRTPAEWNPGWDAGCMGFTTYIETVYADRETGVVVAEVAQLGGPCYCYSATKFHRLEVDTTFFERLESHNASDEV